jgi:cation diffusion facilitator family transporter
VKPEIQEKKITAKKVIVASFAVDLLDILLSVGVAIITGSVIMLTESLEGISDLVSSGLLWIGLKRSSRKEDRSHPFGYGREIYFWTLLAALIMFGVTSSVSIYIGWERFLHPHPVKNVFLAQLVLLIALGTNGYACYLSYKRLLKKRHWKQIIRIFYRSSLVETKTTFILDLMGSVASLVGTLALLIYVITGDIRFDGIGAIIIGIVLAILAFLLLMGIRDLLVGRSASAETENKIREAALTVPEVDKVLDLKTLHVGSEKLLVNLEVNMDNDLNTDELEKLMDKVKESIQAQVPSVKYIQVELETPDKTIT